MRKLCNRLWREDPLWASTRDYRKGRVQLHSCTLRTSMSIVAASSTKSPEWPSRARNALGHPLDVMMPTWDGCEESAFSNCDGRLSPPFRLWPDWCATASATTSPPALHHLRPSFFPHSTQSVFLCSDSRVFYAFLICLPGSHSHDDLGVFKHLNLSLLRALDSSNDPPCLSLSSTILLNRLPLIPAS